MLSEYEKERAANIKANRRQLVTLGLLEDEEDDAKAKKEKKEKEKKKENRLKEKMDRESE